VHEGGYAVLHAASHGYERRLREFVDSESCLLDVLVPRRVLTELGLEMRMIQHRLMERSLADQNGRLRLWELATEKGCRHKHEPVALFQVGLDMGL
jgi:hypothetical protein